MPIILGSAEGIGARLRDERERLNLSQTDFARIGGVSRNSQTAYETGKTPFTSDYLRLVAEAGIDPLYVITGGRSAGSLRDEEVRVLGAFGAMNEPDRWAILRLACSITGRPAPAAAISMPSTEALEEGIAAFLEASPGLQGDELVRELAMSLPTILRGAEDELASNQSDQNGIVPSHLAAPDADRREAQQGRRT